MEKIIPVPSHVDQCCARLRQAGHTACPVGGGVRDLLLGRTPEDWDVATSAQPGEILTLFPHARPTGLAHGTVTIPTVSGPIEVTTFRREGGYSDGRHPDRVTFGASLEEDLARRDFTVNAMALDARGGLIDPWGGLDDLRAGVLRCVGHPRRRFAEDRLRMFRALRFAAQLGFSLHPTLEAALVAHPSTALLAPERVGGEVDKALCSPRPGWVGEMLRYGLLAPWLGDSQAGTYALAALPPTPLARWAGLAALVDSGGLPEKLRRPGALCRAVAVGMALLRSGLPNDARGWRHSLARHGEAACRAAGWMSLALGDGGPAAQLAAVLASRPCLTVKALALAGGDLARLGLSGPAIGRAQARLLNHVLDRPEDNTPELLRSYVERFQKSEGGEA